MECRRVSAALIDLDGCIYRGGEPIEGSKEAVSKLRRSGVKILFLTNNSSLPVRDYVKKLKFMGIDVSDEEILTSALAAAMYLKREYGKVRVLPVGMKGVLEALVNEGHEIVWLPEEDPKVVLVGLDTNFTYDKLKIALRALLNGAAFVATNADPSLPVERGLIPGAGAIVKALETASGRKPVIVGKPSRLIMEIALSTLRVEARETVVIGDRVETDIMAGKAIGAHTILVLSGVTRRDDLPRYPREVHPDLVFPSLREAVEHILSS